MPRRLFSPSCLLCISFQLMSCPYHTFLAMSVQMNIFIELYQHRVSRRGQRRPRRNTAGQTSSAMFFQYVSV